MSGKIIISSKAMWKFLDKSVVRIQSFDWCPVLVKKGEFSIDGRKSSVLCFCNKNFTANLKTQSVLKLWEFLELLEDQPVTLFFDDNWIYIKEAIL